MEQDTVTGAISKGKVNNGYLTPKLIFNPKPILLSQEISLQGIESHPFYPRLKDKINREMKPDRDCIIWALSVSYPDVEKGDSTNSRPPTGGWVAIKDLLIKFGEERGLKPLTISNFIRCTFGGIITGTGSVSTLDPLSIDYALVYNKKAQFLRRERNTLLKNVSKTKFLFEEILTPGILK